MLRVVMMISVFLSLAGGGSAQVTIDTMSLGGLYPRGVAVADFDLNGLLDFATRGSDGKAYVFWQSSAQQFNKTEVAGGLNSSEDGEATSIDYDGDGWQDIAFAFFTDVIALLRNNHDGTFTVHSVSTGQAGILGIDAADMNVDGKQDIVLSRYNARQAIVMHGDGSGGFVTVATLALPKSFLEAAAVAVGDLNLDGFMDVICGQDDDDDPGATYVFFGSAVGTYSAATELYDTNPTDDVSTDGRGGGRADIYDFNCDGYWDVVCTPGTNLESETAALAIYWGNPAGFASQCDTIVMGLHWSSVSLCAPPVADANSQSMVVMSGYRSESVTIVHFRCSEEVAFDIKPGSCPNPINIASGPKMEEPEVVMTADAAGKMAPAKTNPGKEVLPTAILGSLDFDVSDIDVSSIRLIGVAPIRSSVEDVSSPVNVTGEACACTTDGSDGFVDLTLKFYRDDIVAALGPLSVGETRELKITGKLLDGSAFEGGDCIVVVGNPHASAGATEDDSAERLQNYPNPFNPATTISFSLPMAGHVTVKVYNSIGQEVATLVDEDRPAGVHQVMWDANKFASGVYLYRLTTEAFTETKKMLLMK